MTDPETADRLSPASRDACLNVLKMRVKALRQRESRSLDTNYPWDQDMIAAYGRKASQLEEAIRWIIMQ